MKNARQSILLRLIQENDVGTQEELTELLNGEGFNATQATISRDIRDLKIIKQPLQDGSYKYCLPESVSSVTKMYSNNFADSVKSIDVSLNSIVIKTYPGLANAIAANIDSLKSKDILGCVAGDDTVIVIIREGSIPETVVNDIKKMAERKN